MDFSCRSSKHTVPVKQQLQKDFVSNITIVPASAFRSRNQSKNCSQPGGLSYKGAARLISSVIRLAASEDTINSGLQ